MEPGSKSAQPDQVTDAELEELLERPEMPEEKAALDELERDPELVLEQARKRAKDQLPLK